MRRKKTPFEKWFSISRHARRKGAVNAQYNTDYASLKARIIEGDTIRYTHGSKNSLDEHFQDLQSEFIGSSELVYQHAKLIVLIRREADVAKNFALFESLWEQEAEFLLVNMNTRWLVAAADTFADNANSHLDRACSLLVSALVNTIKLSETERRIMDSQPLDAHAAAQLDLTHNRMALADGLSAFAVGSDDTLRNFRWRLDALIRDVDGESIPLLIAEQVFLNLQQLDNVYARFKACHTREKTSWW
jgi:hypothetical protein